MALLDLYTKAKSKLLFIRNGSRFILDYLAGRMMLLLVGILAIIWLFISWLVYRAESLKEGANITSYGEAVWWGVVTLLTVGYGDRYPVTTVGRICASFLMFAGVFAIGIVTAKIASYFLEQALRKGRGIVNTDSLRDHFIICGWKDDMQDLLTHILDFNPALGAKDLVLIANIDPTVMDSIRAHQRLKDLQVLIGDYSNEVTLRRAAPERARKVLLLADCTPGANGQTPTMTETDARTIMTAMTLANIARGTLVISEIIDPKMDQYLKLAGVSEIIYSREYSRLLLGNASGGTGISSIIFDLLDPKTNAIITTYPIPEEMLNRSYSEFKIQFERFKKGTLVIGILENTGNRHRIKELALRQAQKTVDIKRMVQNLHSVKQLRCNRPVFSPASDYIIHEGSLAIVIDTRNHNSSREEDVQSKTSQQSGAIAA